MALTDLEIVFELLPGIHEKLHYLERRADFEANVDYAADEIDLLTFYLQTGFNIGEVEYDRQNSLHLYGMSKQLDNYFLRTATGRTVSKPRMNITRKWKEILTAMEQRQFRGWTEVGVCLLNVSFEDQQLFERRFSQLIKSVRSHWHDPAHENTLILANGPPQRRDAIVGYAYKRVSRERRIQMIKGIISTAAVNASSASPFSLPTADGQKNPKHQKTLYLPSQPLSGWGPGNPKGAPPKKNFNAPSLPARP